MIYLLTVLLFILLIATIFISYRSLKLIKQYEIFYESTLDDLEIISNSIDDIISRKPLFTEDPDVLALIQSTKVSYQILKEYCNVKNKNKEQTQE